MKRSSLGRWPCSIARTMDLLGDWWTPLVLREAFYGIRRFDDFQHGLGIARNTLTDRLTRLVAEGLLEKQAYQEKPTRYDYVLTEKGRDFFGVLAAMTQWGDRWLSSVDGPPVTMRHKGCGQDAHADVVCSACGEILSSDDVTMRLGPGYPERLKALPEVRRRFAQA
ncbi:winged helix-turn-helix transcriptional regulator [Kibdelosporangium phytohabitans]|uniref:HxlR family transcriptional regulator n=1 Tax=Kibdelosporangium phytohabitans TaxID=860235 RepID=A0A0N9I4X4_9PSEU|nr:helix-turn-helix domain-containing protein [Kibdelosporangium phytohabitans]ALG09627.1 HxlR family transcriptional regulator [Kibdelosporangium phytohabitans]MBE1469032.1 DNA-binding HxlR family transcriptional regulator [Kibdelosporangium phytohabitans]